MSLDTQTFDHLKSRSVTVTDIKSGAVVCLFYRNDLPFASIIEGDDTNEFEIFRIVSNFMTGLKARAEFLDKSGKRHRFKLSNEDYQRYVIWLETPKIVYSSDDSNVLEKIGIDILQLCKITSTNKNPVKIVGAGCWKTVSSRMETFAGEGLLALIGAGGSPNWYEFGLFMVLDSETILYLISFGQITSVDINEGKFTLEHICNLATKGKGRLYRYNAISTEPSSKSTDGVLIIDISGKRIILSEKYFPGSLQTGELLIEHINNIRAKYIK